MSDETGKKVLTWAVRFNRALRWAGYVLIFLLMASNDAPPWAWGLLLAVILKRTNTISIK